MSNIRRIPKRDWKVLAVGFAVGVATTYGGIVLSHWASVSLAVAQFERECESKGIQGLVVRPATSSTEGGLSYTPPQFAAGGWLGPASIEILPVLTEHPEIARKLLLDSPSYVRAWTAYLLVRSDESLSRQIVEGVKSLILADRDSSVRRVALAAFDAPFDWTPPHLVLSAEELLFVLANADDVDVQLVAHLVGRGRCRLAGDSDLNTTEEVYERLLEEFANPNGANRWAAYEALSRLLRRKDLSRNSIDAAFPESGDSDSAALRFFLSAPSAALGDAASEIRLEIARKRKLAEEGGVESGS